MKFTKPPLSIEDQLAKLRGRGLAVRDEVVARWALRSLGYYRLSAYTLPFQQGHLPDKPFVHGAGEPVVKDSFTAEPAKHPDSDRLDWLENGVAILLIGEDETIREAIDRARNKTSGHATLREAIDAAREKEAQT